MREILSFGNRVSGLIIKIICYLYIDAEIQDPEIKDLISASWYSDNVNAVATDAEELERVSGILEKAFKNSAYSSNNLLSHFGKCQLEMKGDWGI